MHLLLTQIVVVLWLAFASVTFAQSKYIHQSENTDTVIVFVHGVTGSAERTWKNGDKYWPQMLTEDSTFSDAAIYVYDYPASARANLSIDELANHMRLDLKGNGIHKFKRVVFLVHSMGGLVTRSFLLKNRDIAAKTAFIHFYSTPTTGSQVAALAKLVSNNPQFSQMKTMDAHGFLADQLRQWIAADFEIPSYCAYESKKTFGLQIVSLQSASALCSASLDAMNFDHIDIVKPESNAAQPYLAFKVAYEEEQSNPRINDQQFQILLQTLENVLGSDSGVALNDKTHQRYLDNLLDQVEGQKLIITDLQALVEKQAKRIKAILDDENISDDIKRLVGLGRLDDAEELVDEHYRTTIQSETKVLAQKLYERGQVKELKLKYRVAFESFEQAAILQPRSAKYLNRAGQLASRLAKYDVATRYLQQSLEINRESLGESHPSTASSYNNVASNLDAQGHYEEAEPLYRKGLEIRQQTLGEQHPDTAASYNNVASNLNAQGRYEEAEPLYRKGLEIFQQTLGEQHPDTASSYNNMAYNLDDQGRYEEAEPLYRKGLEIRQQTLGEQHPSTASSYNNVASNLDDQGRYEEAEPLYRRAVEVLSRALGDSHPNTIIVRNNWEQSKLKVTTQDKKNEH